MGAAMFSIRAGDAVKTSSPNEVDFRF